MNSLFKICFVSIVLFTSCDPARKLQSSGAVLPKNISLNGKLFTTVYQQRAAEYRALCYQAYNAARRQIENAEPASNKPLALITDIDETVLDNSAYAVREALAGREYDAATWYDWTSRSLADTMPGSATFLHFAASKNIQVFYITNREEKERIGTLRNLQRYNLPNADNDHLILKTSTSSKELRRQAIMANYNVVLLMGDNLADFSSLFDKKNEVERKQQADANAALFGSRFIVFPNPTYGDWEGSMYGYKRLEQAQKDSVMHSLLKAY